MTTYFLHGLDSSSLGTKGRFFEERFPDVVRPNFYGNLAERLEQFEEICNQDGPHILIGSSFGGLMATHFAIAQPQKVARLILLAPALNFAGFVPPPRPVQVQTLVVIGKDDHVTPLELVVPLARRTFSTMELILAEDDHLLHDTFAGLDWQKLLK